MKLALPLLLFLGPCAVSAQRPPIIDMHLHARAAAYAGADPPAMCTPFEVMPRSDPARGVYEGR